MQTPHLAEERTVMHMSLVAARIAGLGFCASEANECLAAMQWARNVDSTLEVMCASGCRASIFGLYHPIYAMQYDDSAFVAMLAWFRMAYTQMCESKKQYTRTGAQWSAVHLTLKGAEQAPEVSADSMELVNAFMTMDEIEADIKQYVIGSNERDGNAKRRRVSFAPQCIQEVGGCMDLT